MEAVDSSVSIPALADWHPFHELTWPGSRGAFAPAHVLAETYASLTRFPLPHRLSPREAEELIVDWFPPERILEPPPEFAGSLVSRLAEAGITGGATYDALVALTAEAHGAELLTLDRRAETTYQRLGVRYRYLGPA